MMGQYGNQRIAKELRETANDMRLCLAELLGEDYSLLADLLKHFPGRIEGIARAVAEPPAEAMPPEWPSQSEICEAHFKTLLKRLAFWTQLQKNRRKP